MISFIITIDYYDRIFLLKPRTPPLFFFLIAGQLRMRNIISPSLKSPQMIFKWSLLASLVYFACALSIVLAVLRSCPYRI